MYIQNNVCANNNNCLSNFLNVVDLNMMLIDLVYFLIASSMVRRLLNLSLVLCFYFLNCSYTNGNVWRMYVRLFHESIKSTNKVMHVYNICYLFSNFIVISWSNLLTEIFAGNNMNKITDISVNTLVVMQIRKFGLVVNGVINLIDKCQIIHFRTKQCRPGTPQWSWAIEKKRLNSAKVE